MCAAGMTCLMRSACPAGKHGVELHLVCFGEESMLAMATKAGTYGPVPMAALYAALPSQGCAACWTARHTVPWSSAAISAALGLEQSLLRFQQGCAASDMAPGMAHPDHTRVTSLTPQSCIALSDAQAQHSALAEVSTGAPAETQSVLSGA